MTYAGPDRDFGEHDDYEPGDVVHTYDNEEATVVAVIHDRYDPSPWSTIYKVTNERITERRYDGSRLALVKRASELDDEKTKHRADAAYWYAVGYADGSRGEDIAEEFRQFHRKQAREYYAERATFLSSIPAAWDEFQVRRALETAR